MSVAIEQPESDDIDRDVKMFPVRKEFSPAQWAVLFAWPIIAAIGTVYILAPRVLSLDTLRSDVASRPPIAVIDVDAAIASGMGKAPTDQSLESSKQRVQDAARKLRGAGYIVLDTKSVFAYPSDFEAKP
jgi:hypothetical protein